MFDKNNYNYWKCANRIGLFLVVLFIICFFGYYIRPEQDLHLRLIRLTFFGFSGMNLISFIFGAVQSYIWGYILVGILRLVGCCCKKEKKE